MMVTMMDNDNDMETLRWRGCCYNRLFFTWWQKGSHRQTHKYSWQFASLRTCVSTDTSRMARFDLLALKSGFLPAGKIHLHMAHFNENQSFFGLNFHHHFDSGINRKVFLKIFNFLWHFFPNFGNFQKMQWDSDNNSLGLELKTFESRDTWHWV